MTRGVWDILPLMSPLTLTLTITLSLLTLLLSTAVNKAPVCLFNIGA